MRVYNETGLTIEQIEQCEVIGVIRNNWRKRTVRLFKDSVCSNHCFMIGIAFDNSICVVSHEALGMNEHNAIDYWKHGQKVYVRD